MKIQYSVPRRARIEMLPLIDIVFLLLVFFIYAMLSMAVHRGVPVVLPRSETAQIDKKQILTVTIKGDGRLFLDRQHIPLEKLQGALQRKSRSIREPGVLLFADRGVSYQKLFRVLDQIRLAGLTRISLQAESDG
jgi:biopolymer transport protein ExbD